MNKRILPMLLLAFVASISTLVVEHVVISPQRAVAADNKAVKYQVVSVQLGPGFPDRASAKMNEMAEQGWEFSGAIMDALVFKKSQ